MSHRSRKEARTARLTGVVGFAFALALPIALWHHAMEEMAGDFQLDPGYLVTGWSGYGLIALGLALMVPVVLSIGRNPDSRLYPRARNALIGWGTSLYILGAALASIVGSAVGT
ncbi:MAG: hypothetical protein JW895_01245 [Thermoleophilaceae bacterium]|nr:hypothetical protein [Thermoleophilaceae bacterium]